MIQGRRESGFTLIEVTVATAVMGILLTSVVSVVFGIQTAFIEGQMVADLNLQAQRAMTRVVELSGQAVTSDDEFSPLRPATGINSHCLRFRFIASIDPVTGIVTYDDVTRVYIYGPDAWANPCAGLIVGRGANLTEIHQFGSGADDLLGTVDDHVSANIGGLPYVELLVPSNFAPMTGEMFTVDLSSSLYGRLLTFTLRTNARTRDGDYVLSQDLVLTERVALRQ